MDCSAPEIVFDEEGVCNFCHQAQKELSGIRWKPEQGLDSIVKEIQGNGKYDCLIGLSGGVDSSYLLHKAVQFGLRPMCFSVDNGWNDPKADENILNLVEKLKVPFYRYTIDLPRFKELQSAFIKAGLKNIEIPTDHILMATSFKMAKKYGIKYILSGGNVATESIMPPSWGYNARDLTHIEAVYKWATKLNLKGLPTCGLLKWNYYRWIARIKTVYLLDYMVYDRNQAAKELATEYGWQEYGAKHCESVFTHWFQSFYLFEKFGIDKRKAHLSSLINSGQITRTEALEELGRDFYYPKLGIEDRVLQYKKRDHYDFPTDEKMYRAIAKIVKMGNKIFSF